MVRELAKKVVPTPLRWLMHKFANKVVGAPLRRHRRNRRERNRRERNRRERNRANKAVPAPLRWLERKREQYRKQYIFWRAMRRFSNLPDYNVVPITVLSELIYGWDNPWSAKHEYLRTFLQYAQTANGPILECGSGLSTVLLGLVAQRNGNKVWSLEHDSFWAEKVRSTLKRYDIRSVELCTAPLRNYGPYSWYDPPKDRMPEDFSMVICDGPPGKTPGGRYGMLPMMKSHLKPGCIVLLDDAKRAGERKIVARWAEELGTSYRILGSEKPFAIIALPSADDQVDLES